MGVNKLDINDEEDMAILTELSGANPQGEVAVLSSDPYESAPDLAAIASVYSVYTIDSSYTFNGKKYPCRCCVVIDNKGRNGLTENAEYDLVPMVDGVEVVEEALNYVFSLIFNKVMESVTEIEDVDWTLGDLFSFIDAVTPDAILASGSSPLYRTVMSSVTKMEYIYVYDNNVWNLIASSADAECLQTDFFVGNVAGSPRHETYRHDAWRISTIKSTYSYVKNYVNAGASSSFHDVDYLGTVEIKGLYDTYEFVPVFVERPGYLW